VILCLLLVAKLKINIGSVVGLLLIVAALKRVYPPFNRLIESLVRYERTSFIVMGIVHGLTNLGSSLLTAIIHSKQYDKDRTRATTAISYGTFALFQLLTLECPSNPLQLPPHHGAPYGGGREHVPGHRTPAVQQDQHRAIPHHLRDFPLRFRRRPDFHVGLPSLVPSTTTRLSHFVSPSPLLKQNAGITLLC
jgi:hypothetical protein